MTPPREWHHRRKVKRKNATKRKHIKRALMAARRRWMLRMHRWLTRESA